jgi:hypothetical protein
MERLKEKSMPVTMRNIKAGDLSIILKEKYNIKPDQRIDIVFDVKQADSVEEADIDNLGDALIQGFQEIIDFKKGKIDFPPPL